MSQNVWSRKKFAHFLSFLITNFNMVWIDHFVSATLFDFVFNWKWFVFVCVAREAPNPCLSGACGPHSECHVLQGHPVCTCALGMLGTPPNCRPECVIHQECPSNRACIAQQCQDPCIGSCGFNARCTVQNHQPICTCMEGFEGDPYASCNPRQSEYNFPFSYTKNNLILDSYIECNFHLKVLDSPIFTVLVHHSLHSSVWTKIEDMLENSAAIPIIVSYNY